MTEYLELFLWNLLLGEKNELRNRTMHINGKFFVAKKRILDLEKRTLGPKKRTLRPEKRTLEPKKQILINGA